MNSRKQSTHRLAGVAGLYLILILCGGTGTQAGADIHKTATQHVRPKIAGKARPIVYAAVSPDGRLAASYYGKAQVRIWNKRTDELLHTVKRPYRNDDGMNGMYHYGSVTAITFSRTGKWLLVKDGYSVGSGAPGRHGVRMRLRSGTRAPGINSH